MPKAPDFLPGWSRFGIRLFWLAGELVLAAFKYIPEVVLCSGESSMRARARWLQRGCRRALRVFNLEITVTGPIPGSGLLVSNHLSYLDILVLSALAPCVFVAKREVLHWPVFGWFARVAGNVFVNRQRRADAKEAADRLGWLLDHGMLVVLFPEGTSTDGRTVLPFKSSLFEPVARGGYCLWAGRLAYEAEQGNVSEEVCYWKDMTFVPHLLNLLLNQRSIQARVRFAQVRQNGGSRKALARQVHSEVVNLARNSAEAMAALR
jgi:1-acyl-sn-glycerol-3-phosphate acyltransferase